MENILKMKIGFNTTMQFTHAVGMNQLKASRYLKIIANKNMTLHKNEIIC